MREILFWLQRAVSLHELKFMWTQTNNSWNETNTIVCEYIYYHIYHLTFLWQTGGQSNFIFIWKLGYRIIAAEIYQLAIPLQRSHQIFTFGDDFSKNNPLWGEIIYAEIVPSNEIKLIPDINKYYFINAWTNASEWVYDTYNAWLAKRCIMTLKMEEKGWRRDDI